MKFGLVQSALIVILLCIGLATVDGVLGTLLNGVGIPNVLNLESLLEIIFKDCHFVVPQWEKKERICVKKGQVIDPRKRCPDQSQIRMKDKDPCTREYERSQVICEKATDIYIQKYHPSKEEVHKAMPKYPMDGDMTKSYRDACMKKKQLKGTCDCDSKYRTADGSCNNLKNPTWGMSMVCKRRILPPCYVGSSGYRRSKSGYPLPSPRNLSLHLHFPKNVPFMGWTHMYMFFGQIIDHDIAFTPVSTTVNNQAIQCCPVSKEQHPQCDPIIVEKDDPFYSKYNVTCLNFVRSAICPTCALGYRQQMNQVTSCIDGSLFYGNSAAETQFLREYNGTGRLRTQRDDEGGDLLPRSPHPEQDQCSIPKENKFCFYAGDARVNLHIMLATLQTIFLREHNKIADELRELNPCWCDETIFQEARRIVGAIMQVITYKEYLPLTIGQKRMDDFKLNILEKGCCTTYDCELDPTLIAEFSVAAFRFGHSLVSSVMAQPPPGSTRIRRLKDEYFNPFDLCTGCIGELVSGASNCTPQSFDPYVAEDVTNFLFRTEGNPTGLDLAAININRGRDNGIGPYIDMAYHCTGIVITCFDDLEKHKLMRKRQVDALRSMYSYVDDVDLWTGILMEIPVKDGVVGPTAACIIGLQFHNMKFGDRFFFEHCDETGSFTEEQREELKNLTLSTILCRNSNAEYLPTNAMLFASEFNPYIKCCDMKGIDLRYWKDDCC